MGQARRLFDVAASIAVVAAIMMLVRPGSHGPQLVTALGTAFVNAAQGTVGAALVPDAQIPGASSSSSPLAAAGSQIGGAVAGAGGPIGAGIGRAYSPTSYNVPGGLQTRSYF
jgi:hypothetical protein